MDQSWLIYDNIRDFYQRIFWNWEESVTHHGEGYVFNYSGMRWLSGANQLWVDDPKVVSPRLLSLAVDFFRQYLAEWSVVVVPEVFADLRDRCFRYGCYQRWESPIMTLQGAPHITTPINHILVARVRHEPLRNAARDIMGEAFHMEDAVNLRLIRPEHADDRTIRHYVAYSQNRPAAASTMTYTEGIGGIWNVGTKRTFRKRGLASALMARMCADAYQVGCQTMMLMASNMGRPLYQKMGFETTASACYMGYSMY